MLESSRRSFLRTAAMAAPALALPMGAAQASTCTNDRVDPLLAAIEEYHAKTAAWLAMSTDYQEAEGAPIFGRDLPAIPMPTTKEGAVAGLKHAIEEMENLMFEDDISELVAAVLKYVEASV